MSPRRVAVFIWSLERAGAERQVVELLRGMDRARFAPTLITAIDRDDYGLDAAIPRVTLGAEGGFDAGCFLRLVRALRACRAELVHSWMGSMNWYARLAARLAGVPAVVGSVRARLLEDEDMLRERVSRALVTRVIVNSAGIRDELITRARLSPARIDLVENGIDLERFAPLAPEARASRRRGLGWEGRTVLVSMGRIGPFKNQRALVDALRVMHARGTLPADLRVELVGRVEVADYDRALREAAASLPEGIVRWRGTSDAPEELLACADATVLTSPPPSEGLPNVVIESLACGTPALVSPAGNYDALVTDGVEGVALRSHAPEDVAAGVESFLRLGTEARAEMGRRARAHAARRFDRARMVRDTMAVYDRALAEAGAPR